MASPWHASLYGPPLSARCSDAHDLSEPDDDEVPPGEEPASPMSSFSALFAREARAERTPPPPHAPPGEGDFWCLPSFVSAQDGADKLPQDQRVECAFKGLGIFDVPPAAPPSDAPGTKQRWWLEDQDIERLAVDEVRRATLLASPSGCAARSCSLSPRPLRSCASSLSRF